MKNLSMHESILKALLEDFLDKNSHWNGHVKKDPPCLLLGMWVPVQNTEHNKAGRPVTDSALEIAPDLTAILRYCNLHDHEIISARALARFCAAKTGLCVEEYEIWRELGILLFKFSEP